jgi:hypothetical protein
MTKDPSLSDAKHKVYDNLLSLKFYLITCVDEGMIDLGDELYNTILALLEDVGIVANWDEMVELIERSKVLEQDVDVWLSMHGRTSLSLPWPTQKKTEGPP